MDRDYYRLIADVEDRHWWYVARREILSNVLESLHLPGDARVVDVGCGTGGNLSMLARFGRLTALEMDAESREFAAARGICEVVAGSLPGDVPLEPSSYDLVTALDVIEHIEDDAGALADMNRLLAPGGVLLATVPAHMFMWCKHDVVNRHFRRYSRRQLTEALAAAGFETSYSTYFNTWLFPAVATARIVRRILRLHGSSDMTLPSPPVNRMLMRILASEARLVPTHSLPFGVSILVVARRRSGDTP